MLCGCDRTSVTESNVYGAKNSHTPLQLTCEMYEVIYTFTMYASSPSHTFSFRKHTFCSMLYVL